jgi:hypothetical protein
MKIAYETRIQASMETVWAVLLDFPNYPEWNTLLPSVVGTPGPEAPLEVTMSPMGLNRLRMAAKVSGFMPPKYFSFEAMHRYGGWFFQAEMVFRMKEHETGVKFFAEAYITGLSMRFRRATVEGAYRRPLVRLADNLKERVEASAAPAPEAAPAAPPSSPAA